MSGPAVAPPLQGVEGDLTDEVGRVLAEQDGPSSEETARWVVVISNTDEARLPVAESLLTVADGVIGTRGTLEEDGSASVVATFAAGLYQPAGRTFQELAALPSWATLLVPWWLGAGERCLDLRSGVLWRKVAASSGVLYTARWACLSRPGTEVLVADGPLEVIGVEEVVPDLVQVDHRSPFGEALFGVIETKSARRDPDSGSPPRLAVTRVATFVPLHSGVDSPTISPSTGSAPGGENGAARAVALGPKRAEGAVSRAHRAAVRRGVADLLAEQRRAWDRRWNNADVEVVGDPDLTLAARFALFQLAGTAVSSGEAAVGARGLTGPAYSGHVFWDADIFVLPVLAATAPAAARAMLEYRIRRLPAACRAARVAGREGARFPWESAAAGEDVTPKVGYDEMGRPVPIRTGELEEHISADVAWAAWHFASVTGRWDFLEGPGQPLLTETARYFASRVRLDGDGHGHIDGVIGPDEYHEDVDDNAYTNVMAAWTLRRAAEVVERTGPTARGAEVEAEHWRAVAGSLVTGYNPVTGRHQQFAGYDLLEPILAADLGPVPLAADLVLERKRLSGSQIVKQADVVMLHHLVPDALPPGSLQADVAYYLPRTVHGSSLSPGVHASVLARAGRLEQAANLLDLAWRIDLDDLTGTTGGGLHVAALGGSWQALVFGFGGLQIRSPDDPALVVDPKLPEHWKELRIRLIWHGQAVQLRCLNDRVYVGCAAPLSVVVGSGSPVTVERPGRWVERTAGEGADGP
jgi:trehalose/maltose hydrolase-like predicted phosphorylase